MQHRMAYYQSLQKMLSERSAQMRQIMKMHWGIAVLIFALTFFFIDEQNLLTIVNIILSVTTIILTMVSYPSKKFAKKTSLYWVENKKMTSKEYQEQLELISNTEIFQEIEYFNHAKLTENQKKKNILRIMMLLTILNLFTATMNLITHY